MTKIYNGILASVPISELQCDACEEISRSMSNPCQCLSCDPDGTRYMCTCDESVLIKEYIEELTDDNHQLFLDNACKDIDIIVAKLSEEVQS